MHMFGSVFIWELWIAEAETENNFIFRREVLQKHLNAAVNIWLFYKSTLCRTIVISLHAYMAFFFWYCLYIESKSY